MKIKFKKGAPCPVAGMAGSDLCLGGRCPWYVADLKGCIVGVQAATLTSLIDQVQATGKGSPSMASGGTITGSGGIMGHAGEQIDNASVVADGQTVLSKINESFSTGSSGEGAGINVNAPITVNIGTVSKDVDIDRLIDRIGNEGADRLVFALRSRLDSTSLRGIGYLRG